MNQINDDQTLARIFADVRDMPSKAWSIDAQGETVADNELSMVALSNPARNIGYMTLPRLLLIGDPFVHFKLGYFLQLVSKVSFGPADRRFHTFNLALGKENISRLLIEVWEPHSLTAASAQHQRTSGAFEWLSPLAMFSLKTAELPICGVLNEAFPRLPVEPEPSSDNRVAYLGMSKAGANALGRVLAMFACDLTANSISLEHTEDHGGVGRLSCEMEFIKSGTFAAEALLMS